MKTNLSKHFAGNQLVLILKSCLPGVCLRSLAFSATQVERSEDPASGEQRESGGEKGSEREGVPNNEQGTSKIEVYV